VRAKRAKTTLAFAAAIACCFAFAAPALAAPAVRPRQAAATTSNAVLATLTIRTPNVDIKGKKKTSFSKGASGQVLHEGDTLKTDATNGLAEISYTDGSYTRLGPNTEFAITKLSEKQGVRQTQGTLTVGSTWNRAAKVAESGSFEVTAGGATAAVEGTLFSVVCTVPNACQFIDLFDPVLVTMGGAQVQLESAKSVQLDQGQLGSVANLTREDLLANVWVAGNIFLDNVLNFGEPTDLPPATEAPPDNTPPATGNGPVISSDAIVAPASYPPSGGIVVDQPNVQVGGIAAFRGSGCAPGETLNVLFDGSQVGTVPSDGGGNFAGSITIPQGTSPGDHLLTVRGSACELNVVVNVLGAAATRSLAFTGSSSHTLTYVLVGFVAVMVGAVLVFGSRRRRSSGAPPSL
jgi:LPXTG-motif cell wall-anchored protein